MNTLFETIAQYFLTHGQELLWPAVLFGGVLLAGLLLRRIVFGRLRKWAERTDSHLDDLLVQSLYGPVLLWLIILAIKVATDLSRLPPTVTAWSGRALTVLWIISFTLVLSRLAGRLVQRYLREAGGAPVGTLVETLATLAVALLGVLMLLNQLGISITPILTALGVGGIAVALALQDTLSNLFAGFYVSLAGQVRLGDFIQLESGQQGYVSDIGWRSTTLRDRANNLIVIPNNKLAQSIVINYQLPEGRFMLRIPVSVSYASDPGHVERVLVEVVRGAVGEVPELLAHPEPVALLMPGFGDHSLDFTLMCHVTNYDAQFKAQHELRKRILRRFRDEGIVIPFPTRTLEIRETPPA
jgi:small-conductance mechanosensitive channel